MYDDVPYKYPQIEKMVKDFVELTLAPLWRIVIFHSMGQSLSVDCHNGIEVSLSCHIPYALVRYKLI